MITLIKATLEMTRDLIVHMIKSLEKHENPAKKQQKPPKGVLTKPPRL